MTAPEQHSTGPRGHNGQTSASGDREANQLPDDSSGEKQTAENDSPLAPDEISYPEGGLAAWLTVFGAWCTMAGGLGLLNCVASFQNYIANHQLRHYSESTVSWIFSIQAFTAFFCGIQVGPVFDAFGPRVLVLLGSVFLVLAMMMLGECTEYWHFVLDYGVLGGLGSSLLITPPLASIGHFFNRRRAFATGIAMTGSSIGGIIIPLVFRAVYPQLGFPWACRIIAFIILVLLVFANLFLRSRLPRSKPNLQEILPDFKIFADGNGCLCICTAALFLMEFALFIPLAYITSYCVAAGIDPTFSYQILAIINSASVVGRCLPGLVADKVGRFNTNAFMLVFSSLTNFAIWLPITVMLPPPSPPTAKTVIVIYAVMFGIASGSNLSLIGPCIGQLCETKHYDRYFTTCYVFVSFAALIGIPIAGSVVNAASGRYWGLTILTGLAYALSGAGMAAVRIIKVGWRFNAIF